jgi:hypothetical protein
MPVESHGGTAGELQTPFLRIECKARGRTQESWLAVRITVTFGGKLLQ